VEGLVAQQGAALESALWLALRNLQEKAALCHEMSRRAAALNHEITSERFAKQAEEAGSAAALLRDLLARAGADFDEAMGGTIA
jgi:two-component system chemotaxis response regulator CheB